MTRRPPPGDSAAAGEPCDSCDQMPPRVWFNGDDVPAGAWVLLDTGEVRQLEEHVACRNGNHGPLVEVVLPNYEAEVAWAEASARCTHRLDEEGRCWYRCGLERAR